MSMAGRRVPTWEGTSEKEKTGYLEADTLQRSTKIDLRLTDRSLPPAMSWTLGGNKEHTEPCSVPLDERR